MPLSRWFIVGAIISLAACRSQGFNDTAPPPGEPSSFLFSAVTFSETDVTGANVPVSPVSHRIRIKDSGELCLQMNPILPEVIASMTSSGCWGSGCYNIIETDLHIRFSGDDEMQECNIENTDQENCQLNDKPSLHVSSLFQFTPHSERSICARDCSGIRPIERSAPFLSATTVDVYLGSERIGVFDPVNPNKQCFSSTLQHNEGKLKEPPTASMFVD